MNRLSQETSPYLRQHADNPVNWLPWGEEAFQLARDSHKPVLLSVGYAACHWCHVMAHESFEDAETAGLMNHHFINIKVDREERPDIDQVYQNALSLMGQQGGWPLTMFLTPEGKPFWGGTYFPPLARHGLPAFREVLRGVAESFRNEGEKITHNVTALHRALLSLQENQQGKTLNAALRKNGAEQFLKRVDMANGGIGQAPKFPHLPALRFLWETFLSTGDDRYRHAVVHSLTQMCQGGIYDHVGGGFARYAADDEWLVPHFEKMLVDNALFVALLSDVYLETRNPLFESRIHETVSWALREMKVGTNASFGLASSLDADSDGAEGAFYVWKEEDIKSALNADDFAFFAPIYDVSKFGNWEGVNILNRLTHPLFQSAEEEARLRRCLDTLLKARASRPHPGRDDKILADANALFAIGLVKAGLALSSGSYIAAAETLFNFIEKTHWRDGRGVSHSFCDGVLNKSGFVDDAAHMIDAALHLFSATQKQSYLATAEKLATHAIDDFYDEERGGFYSTTKDDAFLPVRPKTVYDSAQPSANAALVRALSQLHLLTGNDLYISKAADTVRAFSGEALQNFFPLASLFSATAAFEQPVSIVIAGTGAEADTLLRTVFETSLPHRAVLRVTEDRAVPVTHPAYGKTGKNVAAYVCAGSRCLTPAHNIDALRKSLLAVRRLAGPDASNDG